MIRDITIGQHFPDNSLVHRFDPRLKLVFTIIYIAVLFAASNPLGLALSVVFLGAMYKVSRIPLKMIGRSLKPILPIILFTAVLNVFFVSGEGEPLFQMGFVTIYAEGIRYAIIMGVRVAALIAGTSLLTYTTSPIVLTDAIEALLRPLAKLHFPVHELAMMMSIALRFIPTLIEETDKIMNAQKGHGHGVPVLPGRRGPHPAEGAEVLPPGLPGRGLLRGVFWDHPGLPAGVPQLLIASGPRACPAALFFGRKFPRFRADSVLL